MRNDEQQRYNLTVIFLQKTLAANSGDAVMEEITFTPRTASWLQLVVDQAGGFKEIEVYYDQCMKGKLFAGTDSDIYSRENVVY